VAEGKDPSAICAFSDPEGSPCTRPPHPGAQYCGLHIGLSPNNLWSSTQKAAFDEALSAAIAASDSDWRGVAFPPDVNLPDKISFPINARYALFNSLELESIRFEETVDFQDTTFQSAVALRKVIFDKNVNFSRARFSGPTEFLHSRFRAGAQFHRSEFSARLIVRAQFSGPAHFNEAIFRDSAVFTGWANVTVIAAPLTSVATLAGTVTVTSSTPTPSDRIPEAVRRVTRSTKASALHVKRRLTKLRSRLRQTVGNLQRRFSTEDPNTETLRVFEAGGQLINATFLKPDQVLFSEIDLSGVHFRGTNLRGMRFLGVNWWQSSLRRNGLHDEVVVHSTKDGAFRHRQLPILEETCRNARVALEENKSFGAASDFYIGEMEALRKQLGFFQRHLFSVAALYCLVSNYGTSVATSLRMLLYLYLLHLGLSLMTSASPPYPDFAGEALQSLKLLALQIPPAEAKHGLVQAWIDAVFRLLAPVQIAMVVLAFRTRIKRH
jgi:uncharacterized protein YjbI with pentapeptide repeats